MQELKYKWIESYKYELAEDFIIKLKYGPKSDIISEWVDFLVDGTLIIKDGFKSDGASGPTIDGKENFRGALAHDAVYYLFRQGLLSIDEFRERADTTLHDICEFDGMNGLRTDAWYMAVRLVGDSNARPSEDSDRQDKIIVYEYEDYNT